ncbi:type III-B CRISPR module RAMP protein Cmr4 [Bacillus sp. DTU_2020_1000418_1_SI_GHA_SEK_038]|uniref:type III-B CRISPR module RAMP protein Cmr4 n=1 Tax=Bacillus sp. DTU_2020_1000418_1_SI_GHA_SEK_038 TaxID=3077585 RepID=UPI0028ED648C|nr:type III-B CRISPR module RAMP protein Cmr4 [Bacillus sp. DTU_2020_1000418_1_SI_GHA_SEK_038]WNS77427.1 type III-B CRISPR module RAMP protein Cmr4 [Bacillus sp. DTU_2020_1000418_1_SI_GHA_SEK_038]
MYTKAKPFLLHAITSVHAGSGSEIGLVDLPIQREQHTGFPKIESSSLKGAIRYTVEQRLQSEDAEKFELVFGSSPNMKADNESQSSAIAFSDARVLLFPVKSMRGIFAWITCPYVLNRFYNEMAINGTKKRVFSEIQPNSVSSNKLIVSEGKIVLEEYAFSVEENSVTKQIADELANYIQQDFSADVRDRIVILGDDDFNDFVRLSTEVNARIKINSETGIVDKGALWYEENVPPETIFYSILYTGNVRGAGTDDMKTAADVEAFLVDEMRFPAVFQLGGNSTLGHGMLRKIWL